MDRTYWHKQGKEPLFPDLIWSKPETKHAAGKLLILGGNSHGFAAPAEAYQVATSAGIGTVRVALPDSLQKTVGAFLENAFFLPGTPSGSLAKAALAELIEHAAWADGVLLTGELGRNSETAVLLESFVTKYKGLLVITRDAADYFYAHPETVLARENTVVVISLSQLQQLAKNMKYPEPVRFQMDVMQLVDWLHVFTQKYPCNIMVQHLEKVFVASKGQISTTDHQTEIWRLQTASKASVWTIQHPSRPFEALTSSLT
jgi:hypothetical protein